MKYDIAIIGTGPAGISAAITAKLRGKNILLLGQKSLSEKIQKAHLIKNYPGLPEVSGKELYEKFSEHLKSMEIEITEDKIASIYAMGKYFSLQGNSTYEATNVILATGVNSSKQIPGEKENLGRGISYCATCDGFFYKGKQIAVIFETAKENFKSEINYLADLAENVLYLKESDVKEIVGFSASDAEKKIRILEKTSGENASPKENLVDGVFILRNSVAAENLVPGLKTENNFVVVNRKMETNIKGLFAAGDITGTPFQYAKAVGEGNVAALSCIES